MNRRDFLKISGLTTAAVASTACAPTKTQYLVSQVDRLAEPAPGEAVWYNTACTMCDSGCGAMVRVIDGRAKKVEGLPGHPVNHGGLCALGQSAVQHHYHPDRLRTALARVTREGDARTPITWDVAVQRLSANLPDAIVVGSNVSGTRLELLRRLAKATGAPAPVTVEPFGHEAVLAACRDVFGSPILPTFDLANSDVVVSFGADLFEDWGPTNFYKWGFGQLRQGRERHRGEFIYVGPRFACTGGVADKFIACKPGTTGAVALGVLRVLSEAGAKGVPGGAGLDPAEASRISGTPEDQIRWLGKKLAEASPGLVLGGGDAEAHSNATSTMRTILALNVALGNVGQPGGVLPAHASPVGNLPAPAAGSFRDLEALLGRARSGAIKSLWLVEADVLHAGPTSLRAAEALRQVPFVASFTTMLDDTAALADLVLADATSLERWGTTVPSAGVGSGAATLSQPAIASWTEAKAAEDVILAAAKAKGGAVAAALPFADNEAFVKSFWANQGDWATNLQAGAKFGGAALPLRAAMPALAWEAPRFEGDATQFPFHLIPVLSAKYGSGEGAALPWMQELPDAITTDTWDTWVEMNPATMKRLGIKHGDYVTVETPAGRAKLVALHHPATPPDAIGIPAGLGHQNNGRYAAGRGIDVWSLVARSVEASGGLAWGATLASVTPLNQPGRPALWVQEFDGNQKEMPTFLK